MGSAPGAIKFTGALLADIYLGKIQTWSDPAIKALNPDLKLPDAKIAVVRRSDGSGTTFNFTDYLSKVSPQWREKVGSDLLVSWPTGTGAKGNDGVSQTVRQIKNSIGYVEYAHAVQTKLSYALVQNRAGEFVKPDARELPGRRGERGLGEGERFPSAADGRARRRGLSDRRDGLRADAQADRLAAASAGRLQLLPMGAGKGRQGRRRARLRAAPGGAGEADQGLLVDDLQGPHVKAALRPSGSGPCCELLEDGAVAARGRQGFTPRCRATIPNVRFSYDTSVKPCASISRAKAACVGKA